MTGKKGFILLLFFTSLFSLYSQNNLPAPEDELEAQINLALDYFGQGDYERAIAILETVLAIEPGNKRAADLLSSIKELYRMEQEMDEENGVYGDEDFTPERPDFGLDTPGEESENGPEGEEELNKPDFSVHDEEDMLRPEETRSRFELSVSPGLVFEWDIGEGGEVLPPEGDYSGNVSAEVDFFFKKWNRIFGVSGGYSLFLITLEEGDFGENRLHNFDILFNFRTFFKEEVDSRTIFKFGVGYRGYLAGGYTFNTLQRRWLNGFNMAVNLEGPILYLFLNKEPLKRFIMGIDMNLLFFPQVSTLNLFDFKLEAKLQFDHFAAGFHFGAYSIITPEESKYIWMTGLNFSLRL